MPSPFSLFALSLGLCAAASGSTLVEKVEFPPLFPDYVATLTPMSASILPNLFAESYWKPDPAVTFHPGEPIIPAVLDATGSALEISDPTSPRLCFVAGIALISAGAVTRRSRAKARRRRVRYPLRPLTVLR